MPGGGVAGPVRPLDAYSSGASNPAPCVVHLPTINTRSRARPGKCLSCPRVAPEGSPPRVSPPPMLDPTPRPPQLWSYRVRQACTPSSSFPGAWGCHTCSSLTRFALPLTLLFHLSLVSLASHASLSSLSSLSPLLLPLLPLPPLLPLFPLLPLPLPLPPPSSPRPPPLFPLTGTVFSQQTPSCPGSSRALLYPEA